MDIYLDFKNAPSSKKRYKHTKPYWSNELRTLWKCMREAEKRFVKCKGLRSARTNLRHIFINAKTNFDRNLRKAERVYRKRTIDNIENICLNYPKEFWKNLKRLGPRKSHAIPMTIRQNDELNSNPIVVLEEWKNKFKQLYNRDDNVNNYDELFYRDVT